MKAGKQKNPSEMQTSEIGFLLEQKSDLVDALEKGGSLHEYSDVVIARYQALWDEWKKRKGPPRTLEQMLARVLEQVSGNDDDYFQFTRFGYLDQEYAWYNAYQTAQREKYIKEVVDPAMKKLTTEEKIAVGRFLQTSNGTAYVQHLETLKKDC